ncbi:MAG: hypothetical protein F6J90_00690 [Moorea sp. SIOASIH]|uniref:hypothetical protein n=1 Tax=Moorena sp. SIOASIH TaxID=2607817 RepID=UPI0013B97456|nr:hypothetical protein [Moorena sp. SIOASIH]NEO34899.1 hypothetical protein [Moorena sp. SIOASIH]
MANLITGQAHRGSREIGKWGDGDNYTCIDAKHKWGGAASRQSQIFSLFPVPLPPY